MRKDWPVFGVLGGRLRNYYWELRNGDRWGRRRRTLYRRVADQKKRLHVAGVDSEAVRLYCLHLASPKRWRRVKRLDNFLHGLGYRPSGLLE